MNDTSASEAGTHDAGGDHESILRETVAAFGADSGTVHLLGDDGYLHLAACIPDLPEQVLSAIRTIPIGKGMAGLAVSRGEPVDSCNIQSDTTGDVRPGAKLTGLKGAIVVPIMHGNCPVGALGVANDGERRFTQAEIDRLLAAGRTIAEKRSGER